MYNIFGRGQHVSLERISGIESCEIYYDSTNSCMCARLMDSIYFTQSSKSWQIVGVDFYLLHFLHFIPLISFQCGKYFWSSKYDILHISEFINCRFVTKLRFWPLRYTACAYFMARMVLCKCIHQSVGHIYWASFICCRGPLNWHRFTQIGRG